VTEAGSASAGSPEAGAGGSAHDAITIITKSTAAGRFIATHHDATQT
jgi:hypothetical protein